ncbi:CPBP family glutamic-type intramembrane protease [Hyphococcus sp.]|jgi:hypothetical protein|uniref:CPBP family glutamic-type intramembrane protease n=1 Tax=Hyphococcus sp. TaxID=2038636 RepID=UPI003D0A5FBB
MELAATFALWWAPVIVLAVLFRMVRISGLRPGWFLTAMAIYAIYMAAIMKGGALIPIDHYFEGLEWNWAGKIASIAATLVMFAVMAVATKAVSPESAGFTLRQKPGSVIPALAMIVLLAGSGIGLELLAADGKSMAPERLLYQATMPGLDEELFFRGLFLAVLGAAVPSGGVNLLGARITAAGLLVTLLFGLGHGVGIEDGKPFVSWIFIAVTGWFGFGLLWVRERTGSVLLPLLGHNLINFSGSFF